LPEFHYQVTCKFSYVYCYKSSQSLYAWRDNMEIKPHENNLLINQLLLTFLKLKEHRDMSIPANTSDTAKNNSAVPKGEGISEKSRVTFSNEAQNIQQSRKDVGPEALKAYEKLTKDEKSKFADTLKGTTIKKLKYTELEIDNRKSFVSGHPHVTKGLGFLNGEQQQYNTFDEKQKDYDSYLKDGKISKGEHTRRTEMNQRLKEMNPEQRKTFMEMMSL